MAIARKRPTLLRNRGWIGRRGRTQSARPGMRNAPHKTDPLRPRFSLKPRTRSRGRIAMRRAKQLRGERSGWAAPPRQAVARRGL